MKQTMLLIIINRDKRGLYNSLMHAAPNKYKQMKIELSDISIYPIKSITGVSLTEFFAISDEMVRVGD